MKDKNTAAILALVLGSVGGHRFYLGQPGMGLLYLMFCWTLIPSVASFIEFIMLLTMNQEAFDVRYNRGLPAPEYAARSSQNIVVNVAAPPPQQLLSATPPPDLMAQLKQLYELKVAGALTEEEFTLQKRKLLGTGDEVKQLPASDVKELPAPIGDPSASS